MEEIKKDNNKNNKDEGIKEENEMKSLIKGYYNNVSNYIKMMNVIFLIVLFLFCVFGVNMNIFYLYLNVLSPLCFFSLFFSFDKSFKTKLFIIMLFFSLLNVKFGLYLNSGEGFILALLKFIHLISQLIVLLIVYSSFALVILTKFLYHLFKKDKDEKEKNS